MSNTTIIIILGVGLLILIALIWYYLSSKKESINTAKGSDRIKGADIASEDIENPGALRIKLGSQALSDAINLGQTNMSNSFS